MEPSAFQISDLGVGGHIGGWADKNMDRFGGEEDSAAAPNHPDGTVEQSKYEYVLLLQIVGGGDWCSGSD